MAAIEPANMIVAPNSPSARAQHRTMPADRAVDQWQAYPAQDVPMGRAIDACGVLVAVDVGQAGPRRTHEERRGDEDLGHHHSQRCERNGEAGCVE